MAAAAAAAAGQGQPPMSQAQMQAFKAQQMQLAQQRAQQQAQQAPPPSWFNGDERHRSICIYPIYINKEKSVAGGRRVPKEIAVVRPILKEMFLVLQAAGFKCMGIPKCHPRDTFKANPSNIGRLHIEFKDSDGNPLKPEIAENKMELLKYLCKMIPELKHRKNPGQSLPEQNQAVGSSAPAAKQPNKPSNGQGTPNQQKKSSNAKKRKKRK